VFTGCEVVWAEEREKTELEGIRSSTVVLTLGRMNGINQSAALEGYYSDEDCFKFTKKEERFTASICTRKSRLFTFYIMYVVLCLETSYSSLFVGPVAIDNDE
jgi:hypothetical protein